MRLGKNLNAATLGCATASLLCLFGGFVAGFISCVHAKVSTPDEAHKFTLLDSGDASASVRSEVLTALRAFQDGYVRRDPKDLDLFAEHLIAKDDDGLLLGTDAGEWAGGHSGVAEFIRGDWRGWGDFRFDVDHSLVSSSGNVAWVTSVGVVHFKDLDRPVRFSAVMTTDRNGWVFRKIQFQWADKNPSSADLLQPKTYFTLPKLIFQRIVKRVS